MDMNELWEDLRFELSGTKIPKLDGEKDKKLILGAGNKEANIMFIGDDSDLYDDEELRVRLGTSGEFLMKLCDLVDLTPEEYYMTNLSKCILKWRELGEVEQTHMKDYLDMQIAIIKPKLIVTLGEDVVSLILKKEMKLAEVRGEIAGEYCGIKVIPIYDPSYVKRSRDLSGRKAKHAIEFWNDLKAIKEESEKMKG